MTKFNTMQEFFADESRWQTNGFAYTTEWGTKCSPVDAEKACIFGALDIVYGVGSPSWTKINKKLLKYLSEKVEYGKFFKWNDEVATIEDIRAACKYAEEGE